MKKKKIIIISLIILIIITFISAYIFIKTQLSIKAIILECSENSILVFDINRTEYVYIGLPKSINFKFKPGQEVLIHLSYNTCTTLTSPASINSQFIKKIKIIKENSNTQILEDYNTKKQERLLEFKNRQNVIN